MKKIITVLILSLFLFSCTNKNIEKTNNLDNNKTQMSNYKEGDVVAVMKTTNGTIDILLETEKAPITTTNFIGLAEQGYYD